MNSNLYFSVLKSGIDKGVQYYRKGILKIHRNMFSNTVEAVILTNPNPLLH